MYMVEVKLRPSQRVGGSTWEMTHEGVVKQCSASRVRFESESWQKAIESVDPKEIESIIINGPV